MTEIDITEKREVPEFWCKFDSVRQALNESVKKHLQKNNNDVEKIESFLDVIEQEMGKVELFEIVGKRKVE